MSRPTIVDVLEPGLRRYRRALGGVLAFCIGVLFVLPIIWVSWAFAYRQVFPDLSPTAYRNEPPPPDAYQGSFGQGM